MTHLQAAIEAEQTGESRGSPVLSFTPPQAHDGIVGGDQARVNVVVHANEEGDLWRSLKGGCECDGV